MSLDPEVLTLDLRNAPVRMMEDEPLDVELGEACRAFLPESLTSSEAMRARGRV